MSVESKLKAYLVKTADYDLGKVGGVMSSALSTPNSAHSITGDALTTGALGALNGIGNGIVKVMHGVGEKFIPSLASIAKPSMLTGLAQGAGGAATAIALDRGEQVAEKGLNYTPKDNNILSRAYGGIQDPQNVQSLYLNSNPDQLDPKTRTWGNFIDQTMTGTGGIKNFTNTTAPWSVGGLGSAVIGAGANLASNVYGVGKGLFNLSKQTYINNQQALGRDPNSINNYNNSLRQLYQVNHNIPMHNPTPQELQLYNLNKQSFVLDSIFK